MSKAGASEEGTDWAGLYRDEDPETYRTFTQGWGLTEAELNAMWDNTQDALHEALGDPCFTALLPGGPVIVPLHLANPSREEHAASMRAAAEMRDAIRREVAERRGAKQQGGGTGSGVGAAEE